MNKAKIVILLALSVFSIFCNKEKNAVSKLEEKMYPNEFFSSMRSYPDTFFDYRAYNKAIEDELVKQKNMSKSEAQWRLEGPANTGGRINVVVAHPTNTNIMFAGNASGGIYKTVNAGETWYSVFDDKPYLAIGDIKFDPKNPNIIYAGTGDPHVSSYPFVGDGIYKSTNLGETWSRCGLTEGSIVSKIQIDPQNSNIIYAATMGLPFKRTKERGVYKSTDAGNTWEQILFISDDAGVADMIIDHTNPDILYATGWNRIRNMGESLATGQAAKIYKSTDGGQTWNILTNGLPQEDFCRIGLCMSSNDSKILYSIYIGVDFEVYGIYKTTDAGQTWTELNTNYLKENKILGGFGWYFGQIRVNPSNNNEIYVLGVDLFRTIDNGETWNMATPPWYTYEVHADKHDIFFINSNNLLLATDGGLYQTTDNCQFWYDIDNIPNNQVYHLAVSPHVTGVYRIGVQDNGTNDGNYQFINAWAKIAGGDGFQPIFHPTDENIFYVEMQNGSLRSTSDGGYNFSTFSETIIQEDRRAWDMPYIMSPHDPEIMFCGTYRIYKNSDAPQDNWTPISPDLTTGENNRYHVLSTISQSIINEKIIYAGASDGNIHITKDGGGTWTNISNGLPQRYISEIMASPIYENTVFVANSGYMYNEYIPHLHRSDNNGATWTDISGDLPQLGINDIWIDAQSNDQIIFVATDGGVYFTKNAGANWYKAGNNLPLVPITDIEYDYQNNRIVAGTYGRSVWSIDYQSVISKIKEIKNTASIRIYPNPSRGIINIETHANYELTVYNIIGYPLYMTDLTQNTTQIDLTNLSNGTYIFYFKGIKTFNFIVNIHKN